MCTRFSNETVSSWLDSQIAVLDSWLESEGWNASDDLRLIETLQTHVGWLKTERKMLSKLSDRCLSLEAAE